MTSPKKILMASHMADPKGSAMSLFTLLTGLTPTQYIPIPLFSKTGALIPKLKDLGIDSYVIPYSGLGKLLTTYRVKALLKREAIDLVYANCAVGYSRAVAYAAKSLGIPVVWHIREPPLGSRVIKNKPHIGKTASKVVAVSEELRKSLAPVAETVKIDNGVDLKRFHTDLSRDTYRKNLNISEGTFIFGMVGSIEDRKNSLMFVETAIELLKNNTNLHFVITGSGEQDYIDNVKSVIEKANANSHFSFTGSVWDTPELMSSLDVLVMPSKWEGFPRVIVESMAVGTPAIASDVGDVSYILDNNSNGIILDKLDHSHLRDAMENAITSPEQLQSMGKSAAEKCHSLFSQDRHVALMQELFDSVTK